jgi:DNA-binding NtrC family response regulator
VLLTAFGSLEGAIEAIKQGAYDYLAKPFKRDDIRLVVQRSLEHCRLVRENARFRDEARAREPWSHLVGSSPAMLEVYKLVARVSDGRSTVLIEGESGTGKELIARAVHLNSPRRDKPFIPVNCGALPDHLLESEMFGYEKGAFTGAVGSKGGLFEAANGGTLFLDEIGDLGQALQVKLLRVMQEHEVRRVGSTSSVKVDVRIIAATKVFLSSFILDKCPAKAPDSAASRVAKSSKARIGLSMRDAAFILGVSIKPISSSDMVRWSTFIIRRSFCSPGLGLFRKTSIP